MIERMEYLNRLIKVRDKKIIKVITGIRRCGKSTLLMQFSDYLLRSGVGEDQIISINLEDIKYEDLINYRILYNYVSERLVPDGITYIFLDEIQTVPDYQKAVDSLFIKENVDIYITGSNAYLLSGELSTLLSGRYIEINMLPLSFSEYYEAVGGDKRTAFTAFYQKGAFPYAVQIADEEVRRDYIQGIYSTVLLKDVIMRNKISDSALLESIARFLLDNIGNIVSVNKTADVLSSGGRKTAPVTVDNYISALTDAYIMYKAKRYDIAGNKHLQSLEKYYSADLSLRHLILGKRDRDIGRMLENIVYLELLRRNYSVYIGKLGTLEVDFVAVKSGEPEYYQVSASVLDPNTFDREFKPLQGIRDNFPKYILTMDDLPLGENGIKQLNLIDWLLGAV